MKDGEKRRNESKAAFKYMVETAKAAGFNFTEYEDFHFGNICEIIRKLGGPEREISGKPYEKFFLHGMSPLNYDRMLYVKETAEAVGLEVKKDTAFNIEFIAEIVKRLQEGKE